MISHGQFPIGMDMDRVRLHQDGGAEPGSGPAGPPGPGGRLATGLFRLDVFLGGGLAPGEVSFLRGDAGFVHMVECLALVRCVAQLGRDAVLVDAGMGADPYMLSSLARRFRLDPGEAASRIHVSRSFTAHQLDTVLRERLPEAALGLDAGVVVVSSLLDMYLDAQVGTDEARAMVMRDLASMRALCAGRIVLLTDLGTSLSYNRGRLAQLVEGASHRSIAARPTRRGLCLRDRDGHMDEYRQVPPWQWTLDDFSGA